MLQNASMEPFKYGQMTIREILNITKLGYTYKECAVHVTVCRCAEMCSALLWKLQQYLIVANVSTSLFAIVISLKDP